jgi:hypothetical protein
MYSAPGYTMHKKYCINTADQYSHPKKGSFPTKVERLIAYTAHSEEDNETGVSVLTDSEGATLPVHPQHVSDTKSTESSQINNHNINNIKTKDLFDLNGPELHTTELNDELKDEGDSAEMELLKIHCALSHLSMVSYNIWQNKVSYQSAWQPAKYHCVSHVSMGK